MSRNHRRLTGARWQRLRRAAFDRDAWRCTRCESPLGLEAHHDPPLHTGADPWSLAGVRTLCASCHIDAHRTIRDPERAKWLKLIREGE